MFQIRMEYVYAFMGNINIPISHIMYKKARLFENAENTNDVYIYGKFGT